MNETLCTLLAGWARRQIKQASTQRGIVVLATAAAAHVSPDAAQAIISAGASIFAAIDILKDDNKTGADK